MNISELSMGISTLREDIITPPLMALFSISRTFAVYWPDFFPTLPAVIVMLLPSTVIEQCC